VRKGLDIAGVLTATVISAIAIIAILLLLWRSSREIKDLCNAIGGLIAVLFVYLVLAGIYKIIFIFSVMMTLVLLIYPGVRKVRSKALCDLIR